MRRIWGEKGPGEYTDRVEGPIEPRNAASARETGRPFPDLRSAFCSALAAPDVRGARRMIAQAADAGALPGRLYVDVVRPALAELQELDHTFRRRLAAGIGDAIVADLASHVPLTGAHGSGRAALLTPREDGVEGVDGTIAIDFLEADGWSVERLVGDASSATPAHALTQDGAVELAVAITAGPEDALRLAPMCTALRRLADPPVIVLCDFTGRPQQRAATSALGADAVAHDPGELITQAAHRLPGPGIRRWGVRLQRQDGALILAPTGRLDPVSVARLAEVAVSRLGTFSRLVVDLRDLAEIDEGGMSDLSRPPWSELSPVVWSDARTRARLAGISHAITLTAVD